MSKLGAFICNPEEIYSKGGLKPSFNGCTIELNNKIITIDDKTSTENFAQELEFDEIYDVFDDFIMECPENFPNRVISLCNDYSLPPTQEIIEICVKFARFFMHADREEEFTISTGLVHNDYIQDLISLESNTKVQTFEAIPVYHVSEAVDLIESSIEGMKRLKDALFVLHIQKQSFFFEWVIIPRCDLYVDGALIPNLPATQRVLFVFKKLASLKNPQFEHFRKQSLAFRLISDSFADIETAWIGHIHSSAKLLANAAVFNFLRCVDPQHNYHFEPNRSELFQAAFDISGLTTDEEGEADELLRRELERLGEREVSLDDLDASEAIRNRRRLMGEEYDRFSKKSKELQEEQERLAKEQQMLSKKQQQEEARRQKEEARKQKEREEAERKAEEERKKQEEEEQRKALAEERQRRLQEIRSTRKRKKVRRAKREEINHSMREYSSTYSRISRRNKLQARVEKLRALDDEEEEYEEEEEDVLDEDEQKRREVQAIQKRQKRLDQQRLLMFRCMKAVNDPNSTQKKLEALNKELQEELERSREFRRTVGQEIVRVRNALKQKKAQAEETDKMVEESNQLLHMIHNDRVQQRYKISGNHYQPPPVDKNPEYAKTKELLLLEKKRLEADIKALQRKLKAKEKQEAEA